MKSIWVFIETRRGEVAPVSLEILSKAKELAKKLSAKTVAIVLSPAAQKVAQQVAPFSPDEVIFVDNDTFCEADEEMFARSLFEMVNKYEPEVILAGATVFGRAMMPLLAALLETGLTADCLELNVDTASGLLLASCPGFGGNIMAEIVCPKRLPQMATVRPNVFKAAPPNPFGQTKLINESLKDKIGPSCEFIEFIKEEGDLINLEDADVIVGCGRGASSENNLNFANELARLLGGAIGVTRPLVDNGLASYQQQIGQTGKTVAPKLYIACGISGAIHHVAGIKSSDCIVAINKDPSAPIFDVATFGLVGDVSMILPALIDEIKKNVGGSD